MQRLTKDQIQKVLTERLRLKDPTFRLERSGGRIFGSIIDDRFRGLTPFRRLSMVYDALEKAYGRRANTNVGMLLLYTPEEWDMPLEGLKKPRHRKAG